MAAAARRVKRMPGDPPAEKLPPSAVRKTFASNVKLFRESLGWSQAKLAEMCAMTQKHIWEIETTAKNVTLDTITGLAEQLGKSEIEMLTPSQCNP